MDTRKWLEALRSESTQFIITTAITVLVVMSWKMKMITIVMYFVKCKK